MFDEASARPSFFQKNDMLEVEAIFYISKCWKFPMLKVFYGGSSCTHFCGLFAKMKEEAFVDGVIAQKDRN